MGPVSFSNKILALLLQAYNVHCTYFLPMPYTLYCTVYLLLTVYRFRHNKKLFTVIKEHQSTVQYTYEYIIKITTTYLNTVSYIEQHIVQ